MTISAPSRQMLRAFALGDTATADRLNDELPDADRGGYFDLVAGLFAVLLERRFADGVSRDTISTFVNELRYDFRSAQPPINALAVEGVIRAAFGDDHLLANLSDAEVLHAQHQVITKIAAQDPVVHAGIDRFLDEAEATVASWDAAEG